MSSTETVLERRPISGLPFAVGFIVVLVLGVAFVVSGESIPVTPHDQLDIIVPLSELQALHFGEDYLPEMMGGMPSSAATVGVPGMALFYLLLPGVYAYSVNLVFVLLVSYLFMYLCLTELSVRNWTAAVTAFMFASLPFYSVYALSVMGVPIMVYATTRVIEGGKLAISLVLTLFYGVFSSLVWVGYAVCFSLVIVSVVLLVRRSWRKAIEVLALLMALVLVYAVANLDTVLRALSPSTVGHRAEFSETGGTFDMGGILAFFVQGQYHAVSNHRVIMGLMITVSVCFGAKAFWERVRHARSIPADLSKLFFAITLLLVLALAIAVFEKLFSSDMGIEMRSHLPGTLKSFMFDRFYWLYPTIWYIGAGITFELLMRIANEKHLSPFGVIVVLLTAIMTLGLSVPSNDAYQNLTSKIAGGSSSITWGQFFSESLFDEIEEDLNTREGGAQSSYKVASVAMHPSVALHNGFYTLDGYSMDYPLEYKHAFGEIIEPELDASPSLYDYFWNWGSRCYLFSRENEAGYVVSKTSEEGIDDLRIDTQAFKELGGDYIFSAVPINNAESLGLELVDTYSDEGSYYRIWVYEAI